MTSTANNVSAQIAADLAALQEIRFRVACTPDSVPASDDVARVSAVLQRWEAFLSNFGAAPRDSTSGLIRYICSLEYALVQSSSASTSSIARSLFNILGYESGITKVSANHTFQASGMDPKAALEYASTVANAAMNAAGNKLQTAVDEIEQVAPAAFESCQTRADPSTINVRAMDRVMDDVADLASLSIDGGRSVDSSILCRRRKPQNAFFSKAARGTLGTAHFGLLTQNALGVTARIMPNISAAAAWANYACPDGEGVMAVGFAGNAGAQPVDVTDPIINLHAADCWVKFRARVPVSNHQVIARGTFVTPTWNQWEAVQGIGFATGLAGASLTALGVGTGATYAEAWTEVISRGDESVWEACIYFGDEDDYELSISDLPLGTLGNNDLSMIEFRVKEMVSAGLQSYDVYEDGAYCSGDLSSAADSLVTEDSALLIPLKRAEEAFGALRRYNAFLQSSGINGPAKALANSYYTVASASDTYTPSANAGEFLCPEFYMHPTIGLTASTKRRLLCSLYTNLSSMLYVSSADDPYAVSVGGC